MSSNLPASFNAQFFADDGTLAAGYLLHTYVAGTTTDQTTYTDAGLTAPNTNPIVLDAAGRCELRLDPALLYDLVLKTDAGATVKTFENVCAAADASTAVTLADLAALDAADISFTTGTSTTWFAGTNVADALDDIISRADALPAASVTIADSGAHFTSTNVEGALAELATSVGGAFSLPSQTGNSGKYLGTNGTAASWSSPLPSQTSNSGKYLTTDGSAASWAALDVLTGTLGATGSVTIDGFVLKWGQTTSIADASSASISFGTAFPNAIYGVQATAIATAGDAVGVSGATTSGFTVYVATACQVFWFAYGS